jgi:CheY-like chemotaxis protein
MKILTKVYTTTTIQDKKDCYYSPILDNDNFYHSNNNNNNHHPQHYHSQSPTHPLQNHESNTTDIKTTKEPLYKRILIVDDDIDITFTYKLGLERYYEGYDDDDDINNKIKFQVYTYNDPLAALSEFKPYFYDLLLIDINMPDMNGFELYQKILELDVNVRVCFITAGEANYEALRELYPNVNMGCFIKKPVSIDYLIKRLSAELD